jgi:metallo-beta-lactamase family protein
LRLSFHGADRDVTGSCHLVECAGRRVLIDCGLYQGSREIAEENTGDFGFDPTGIDFVLLTHAHLDHCGRLPLLTRRGFHGEIIATTATQELARLVMLDAAHLQEEEARSNSHRPRHGADNKPAEPLFTVADTLKSLELFRRRAVYGKQTDLAQGIRATFVDAGHILGSASILLELTEAGRSLRLLYKPIGASVDELYEAISDTLGRGGNVIIPTFALGPVDIRMHEGDSPRIGKLIQG